MIHGGIPPGYVRVTAGRRVAITLERNTADANALLANGSLHEAASRIPDARPLQGRGVAFAIALPISRECAVVRHNQHGGILAGLTGDLVLPPSRAPDELRIAHRLADAGIPTPEVLMYGLAPAAVMFCRADVVTREVVGGRDLASYMQPSESESMRSESWAATCRLLHGLAAAGARHRDLNVKNVLLAQSFDTLTAYVLDVDRVTFHLPGSAEVRTGNLQRLLRSARKWRDERGGVFDERDAHA